MPTIALSADSLQPDVSFTDLNYATLPLSEDMGRNTSYKEACGGARWWEESTESRNQHMKWLRRDQ